jgi:glycerophosphoryl diester phosphodiesterase
LGKGTLAGPVVPGRETELAIAAIARIRTRVDRSEPATMTEPRVVPPVPRSRVAVIAHRGASAYAPEHTWPAYELAMEMGVDFLEPDLRMTRDGHLVAFHDRTLERTGRGDGPCRTGAVSRMTLAELGRCDVGGWFNEAKPARADPLFAGQRVVTFDALLDRWGHQVRWYPELKDPEATPGMEAALLAVLERHGLQETTGEGGRVLIQSFSEGCLRRIRALDPDLPLVQLLPPEGLAGRSPEEVLAAVREYAGGVGPHKDLLDEAFMHAARALGLRVDPWTVDEPDEMDRLIGLGVDGIFTNVPDVLLARRDRARGSHG